MRRSTTLFFTIFFIFSFWLMFLTFSYDGKGHAMIVASKVWSDFGSHIALIRSFSYGENWPPQYPLFPGEPIRYHFLFYALVGILEKTGVRIDWAMNIPSSIGFFLLLVGIFALAKKLFHDQRVAMLSILFFLFNGSLSFVQFFQKHPLSLSTFKDIVTTKEFYAFAPWGKGDITAFWNLNIYTNQRHLALAFGIAILFLYTLIGKARAPWKGSWRQSFVFALFLGLLPFFHQPTLAILTLFMGIYILIFPNLRRFLLTTGVIASFLILPQLQLIHHGTRLVRWYPGYLINDSLTVRSFLSFWWQNLGLHLLFIPLGFLLAPARIKKFFLPIIVLFAIANLFKFSPEIAANHKFFNFFLIFGNMLSASAIVWYLNRTKRLPPKLAVAYRVYVGVVVLFLILSGVIDFFAVANDPRGPLADIGANKTATWIVRYTPKNAMFLNSSFLFHPASLAGRKIFLGWPYFSWSAGYDTDTRLKDMQAMYKATNLPSLCHQLAAYHIDYITIQSKNAAEELIFNEKFFNANFTRVFSNKSEGFAIYSTRSGCP